MLCPMMDYTIPTSQRKTGGRVDAVGGPTILRTAFLFAVIASSFSVGIARRPSHPVRERRSNAA